MTTYTDPVVWGVFLAIGLLTFAIRFSFVFLFGRVDTVPPRVERALRYVPAAVLAALVIPSLVTLEGSAEATLADGRLVAGGVAAAVAWRTEDVLATVGVGMGVLWAVRFLL